MLSVDMSKQPDIVQGICKADVHLVTRDVVSTVTF